MNFTNREQTFLTTIEKGIHKERERVGRDCERERTSKKVRGGKERKNKHVKENEREREHNSEKAMERDHVLERGRGERQKERYI